LHGSCLRGAEAQLLEFESGESFLAAEKEQRFTAAFLDIYMHGMSGMDAARELRKTDADCLLIFTTTSTDHALEGFQVRALHYPFPRRSFPPCLPRCSQGSPARSRS
jgi:two-component system response regulator LytT